MLDQHASASLYKRTDKFDEKKEIEVFKKIKSRYDNKPSPYYAAYRLWTDDIIAPLETRKWISMGIEAANHAPVKKDFNMGVIQT